MRANMTTSREPVSRRTNEATTMRRLLAVMLVLVGVGTVGRRAEAQEIQLTGPLAGAPAVRSLRLHRQGRLELAPTLSFTLLDEYQRTMLVGARANYNLTDWFAVGVWGAFGAVHQSTALTDHIDETVAERRASSPNSIDNQLTKANIPGSFKDQLGTINYVFAPQVTFVPFRGKLAIFQKFFVDTDAYFFAGPAFVGLKERADCSAASTACDQSTATASRTAISPTFGLGFAFYSGDWMSVGVEWRALPFSWNTGGFDAHGSGANNKFPDQKIDDKDREFKFNQVLSLSVGFYLPQGMKRSE